MNISYSRCLVLYLSYAVLSEIEAIRLIDADWGNPKQNGEKCLLYHANGSTLKFIYCILFF